MPAAVAYEGFLLSDGELGSIPCFSLLHNLIDISSCIIKEFRSREAPYMLRVASLSGE